MEKICQCCGKHYEDHTKSKFCSKDCWLVAKTRKQYPDGSDYVECKICGYRGSDLNRHITRYHKISKQEYCNQFNLTILELQSAALRKHNSDMQKLAYKEGRLHGWGKGDANPSRRAEVREGRKSIFSMNCEKYDGMTDEEKKVTIEKLLHNIAQEKAVNNNNPLTIDYYVKRGFTEEAAKEQLKLRQTTFSKEKCVEKYGRESGLERWKNRQEKWQKTLNDKPIEEIERINRLKAKSSKYICAYSKISQELFDNIYEHVKDLYKEIFYATRKFGKQNFNENFEYEVVLPDNTHRHFLDFYIKDINKVIEFDGDYWHGEKRGNQERDRKREENLKALGYTNILHVREHDYRANPDKVLQECLDFIKEGNEESRQHAEKEAV